ncbi:MAG: CvpA family protein [Syntrophomonas sp.]|nr:CvpA family protein [Syntrophomonas sp.]
MGFNLLDYIIIAILLLSVIIGYQRGFIATLGGILSTLIGVGVAFMYRNDLADYLQEQYGVVTSIAAALEKHLPISAWGSSRTSSLSSLAGLSEGLNFITRQINELAYLLVAIGCFLILFLISSYLIRLLCTVLEKLFAWGILEGINRLAGAGILLIQNIIIITVLLGLTKSPLGLGAAIGITGISRTAEYIEGSLLVPYFLKGFLFLQDIITGSV